MRPSLAWAATFAALFCLVVAWLSRFAARLAALEHGNPDSLLRTVMALHGPIAVLSLAGSLAIYMSDQLNHEVANFLQPTAPVLVLLAVLATAVAQGAILRRRSQGGISVSGAIAASQRWAIPLALALLGLLQGASYLWVIGNDFTRYWNLADAMRSGSGYPAIANLPIYIQIGEPLYCIDLPGFSMLLLPAFALAGHDTLGASLPNLVANVALPVLLYVFYQRAGLSRLLSFAGSCVLVIQPFFRLYTLNAPVPDAVFLALLVATSIAWLRVGEWESGRAGDRPNPSPTRPVPHSPTRPWLVFGLLAGAITLTRPEGIFFLGFMGLALLPRIRTRGPYLAAAVFLLMVLPFVGLMYSTFGFLWPNNAGSTFGLNHVGDNIFWLERKTLRWYADAFQISVPQLLAVVGLLVAGVVAGSAWMSRRQWQLAVLPLAGVINVAIVFTVDQTVSGVHLWFDFFRHISYGLPFLLLPLLFLLGKLTDRASAALPPSGMARIVASYAAALILLAISFCQLEALSHPSQTYGSGSTQLLTSDTWVSFQDIVAHRYQLPQIPFARDQRGLLVINPAFDRSYMVNHLESVNRFFEPYSTINVNRGSQYEISSALVLLFASIIALVGSSTASNVAGDVARATG